MQRGHTGLTFKFTHKSKDHFKNDVTFLAATSESIKMFDTIRTDVLIVFYYSFPFSDSNLFYDSVLNIDFMMFVVAL